LDRSPQEKQQSVEGNDVVRYILRNPQRRHRRY